MPAAVSRMNETLRIMIRKRGLCRIYPWFGKLYAVTKMAHGGLLPGLQSISYQLAFLRKKGKTKKKKVQRFPTASTRRNEHLFKTTPTHRRRANTL